MTRIAVNKYVIIRNDGLVTGLVAADNLQEAQDDAADLGLVGTILTTEDWLLSPEHAAQQLDEKRAEKKGLIDLASAGINRELAYVNDASLDSTGLARKAVVVYAQSKKAWVDTATEMDLDAYDPLTDPQLQV